MMSEIEGFLGIVGLSSCRFFHPVEIAKSCSTGDLRIDNRLLPVSSSKILSVVGSATPTPPPNHPECEFCAVLGSRLRCLSVLGYPPSANMNVRGVTTNSVCSLPLSEPE